MLSSLELSAVFSGTSFEQDRTRNLTCLCSCCWPHFPVMELTVYPLASEESREVANLVERKNLHTHKYGVKEFVYNFDPNYLRTG